MLDQKIHALASFFTTEATSMKSWNPHYVTTELLKHPCLLRVKRLQAVPPASLFSTITLVTCRSYQKERKKKTQQKWIFIYQAWAMETNSHLCISNSLHTGGWAHQGLCISQQAVLGEKILYTGRSKLHLSCFLEGAEYHKSFQAKSSSDVNQHFPDKIGGPTFNFSCYVCGCTHLL